MAKITGLINGVANQNRDYHYSLGLSSIINPGVISGLELSQDGTDISITSGEAVISVTRTSVTPNETFLVAFISTATETVTMNASEYLYIEINPTRVDDPALNVESSGTGIGDIVASASLPSSNYILLGQTDGSGNIQTTGRELISFKENVLNDTDLTGLTINITTTGDIEANSFTGDGTGLTGVTFDINGQTEDETGDMDSDYVVKFDGSNKKIKVNKYRATTAEIEARTSNTKFVSVEGLGTALSDQIQDYEVKNFGTNYLATENGFVHGWGYKNSLGGITFLIYSDGSSTPTTLIGAGEGTDSGTSGFCCPIKKGNYYRVEVGGTITQALYFTGLN